MAEPTPQPETEAESQPESVAQPRKAVGLLPWIAAVLVVLAAGAFVAWRFGGASPQAEPLTLPAMETQAILKAVLDQANTDDEALRTDLADAVKTLANMARRDRGAIKALEALRAGDVDPALKTLRQRADAAAARLDMYRLQVANAYREVGALTGLSAGASSGEAYGLAASLAPELTDTALRHGLALLDMGEEAEATAILTDALALAQEPQESIPYARAHRHLGQRAAQEGRWADAVMHLEEAARAFQAKDYDDEAYVARLATVEALWQQGDVNRARRRADALIVAAGQGAAPVLRVDALLLRAAIKDTLDGDAAGAMRDREKALNLAAEADAPDAMAAVLGAMTDGAVRAGNETAATAGFDALDKLLPRLEGPMKAQALEQLATWDQVQGRLAVSGDRLEQAIAIRVEQGEAVRAGYETIQLGMLRQQQQPPAMAEARTAFQRALALFQQAGDVAGMGLARSNMALLAWHSQDLPTACRLMVQAQRDLIAGEDVERLATVQAFIDGAGCTPDGGVAPQAQTQLQQGEASDTPATGQDAASSAPQNGGNPPALIP